MTIQIASSLKFEVQKLPSRNLALKCTRTYTAQVRTTYELDSVTYLTQRYGWWLLCSLRICR